MQKPFVLIVLGTTALIVAASLFPKSLAQSSPATPSGATQPIAPGFKIGAPLSTITLRPAIAEVKRIEYLSNGFIEASHALVLVSKKDKALQKILTLAQKVATQTLATRSSLAVVDVSIYQAEGYAGFGGPSPLLTVSVPRQKLGALTMSKLVPWTNTIICGSILLPRRCHPKSNPLVRLRLECLKPYQNW